MFEKQKFESTKLSIDSKDPRIALHVEYGGAPQEVQAFDNDNTAPTPEEQGRIEDLREALQNWSTSQNRERSKEAESLPSYALYDIPLRRSDADWLSERYSIPMKKELTFREIHDLLHQVQEENAQYSDFSRLRHFLLLEQLTRIERHLKETIEILQSRKT